ncbi:T9SS type A sorting domain-containing protein, partial [bacterium]|nr:T9SS type A sorting domain-containing protein [bacterium]
TEGILSNLTPDAYTGTFQWLAQNDCRGTEGTVLLRVLPNNGKDGIADSKEISVDYNEPPAVTIHPFQDKVSGDVTISYSVTDAETDRVNIAVWYSADGGTTWGIPDAEGDFEYIAADGSTHVILWHSENDLPGIDSENIRLKMIAADFDSSQAAETGPFHLDNDKPPSAALSVDAPDSAYVDFVDIRYTLADEEEDSLSVTVSYSTDGGVVYHPATVEGTLADITPEHYASSLRWDTLKDLPDYTGPVIFRALPADHDDGTAAYATIKVNTFGPCSVTINNADTQDSTVIIDYMISDLKNHTINLKVEYSVNNGTTYQPASTTGQVSTIPPSGYNGSFTWNSSKDLAGFDGNARLKVTPNNGSDGQYSTQDVYVDYNQPPAIRLVSANSDTLYSGTVVLTVKINDAEKNSVLVRAEYSLDDGVTYKPATLTDSLGIKLDSDAVLSWRAFRDIGFVYNARAMLRITARDNDPSEPLVTGPFSVTNLAADYSFDRAIDGNDLPLFLDAWKKQDLAMEIGPASGTVPEITIHPDKKIDFEDLAIFVMMWNWYTEQSSQQKPAFKPVTENSGSEIRLLRQDNGTLAVISDKPPDYMNLIVSAECRKNVSLTVTGSGYWTEDNTGITLTRPFDRNLFEIASGLMSENKSDNSGPYTLATIKVTGELSVNDIIRASYKYRGTGEGNIVQGSIVYTISEMTVLPAAFTMYQNSPNPFNPSTTISFELPDDSRTTITIYTIEGQIVTVLVNDLLKAGFHSYIWDAGRMPSGVYLYTIHTNGFSGTKKMMLLK